LYDVCQKVVTPLPDTTLLDQWARRIRSLVILDQFIVSVEQTEVSIWSNKSGNEAPLQVLKTKEELKNNSIFVFNGVIHVVTGGKVVLWHPALKKLDKKENELSVITLELLKEKLVHFVSMELPAEGSLPQFPSPSRTA
jgi:hypothetical protein